MIESLAMQAESQPPIMETAGKKDGFRMHQSLSSSDSGGGLALAVYGS
mgnify:CR=1 FL=1